MFVLVRVRLRLEETLEEARVHVGTLLERMLRDNGRPIEVEEFLFVFEDDLFKEGEKVSRVRSIGCVSL